MLRHQPNMYRQPGTQHELFNKKTLPLIPPTAIFQNIPLAPPPRAPRPELDESGEPIDCGYNDDGREPSSLADNTQRALQVYNRYLELVKGSRDETQRRFSGEFVELASEITMISETAGEEIQRKLEAMCGVVEKMFGRFELDEMALLSGRWASKCHGCTNHLLSREELLT